MQKESRQSIEEQKRMGPPRKDSSRDFFQPQKLGRNSYLKKLGANRIVLSGFFPYERYSNVSHLARIIFLAFGQRSDIEPATDGSRDPLSLFRSNLTETAGRQMLAHTVN